MGMRIGLQDLNDDVSASKLNVVTHCQGMET